MNEDKPERMPNTPPFVRFVCSAIPMVFDDSLSYYEALCALWKYVQGMTDVINNNATLEEEYILKFNELKTFVDTYFDNLDVQEEINNKLDQMAEDGTLQEIIGTYLGIVTPKMFGAVSGTGADQSEAISDCLDYAFSHGIKNVYLDGDYFVDSRIEFTGKSDITIKNGTIRVHEVDANLSEGFQVFRFVNCTNIKLENIRVLETSPEARSRNLYTGGFFFRGSAECSVKGCYFENTYSGIIFKDNCHDCVAENNEILVNYHSAQFASSAILNYASYDNIIKGNTITGEFYDGTLSVYGGNCKNVIVDSNIIKGIFDANPIWLSEGICIDAACDGTVVTNNIVSGQYYGIDNKNDTRNTLIANNYVFGCKVAITDRPGEEKKQTFNCQIENNNITIQTLWNTDSELANILFKNAYYYEGIYVSGRLGGCVKGNKVCLYKKTDDKTICGISCDATGASSSNVYQSQFDIENNTIEFANGFGAAGWYAAAGSTGIYVADAQKGSILGNTLKVDVYGYQYSMITFAGNVSYMNVQNNSFFATSRDSHSFVTVLSGGTVTNSTIINNLLKQCIPYFNLGSPTNLVEMPNYIRGHQIAPVTLTANTPAKVATITPRYAGLTYVKIMGLRSASGSKYIFGEYLLDIQDSTVTSTQISESANGLTVSFEHGDNNRNCDIKITSTANIPNFGQLFICDAMTDQALTYA